MEQLVMGGFIGLLGSIIFLVLIWLFIKAYQRFVRVVERMEKFDGTVKLLESDCDAIGKAALERIQHSCRYTRIRLVMGHDDYKMVTAIGFQLSDNHFMGDPITVSVRVSPKDGFDGLAKAFEMLLYAVEDPHNRIFKAMTLDKRNILEGMSLDDYETVITRGEK